HAEGRAEIQLRVAQHGRVAAADQERRVGECRLHRGVAGNVVGVAVGVEDGRRPQALLAQVVEYQVRLQTGIDDQRVLTRRLPDDVGVLLERLRYDGVDLQHGRLRGSPPLPALPSLP